MIYTNYDKIICLDFDILQKYFMDKTILIKEKIICLMKVEEVEIAVSISVICMYTEYIKCKQNNIQASLAGLLNTYIGLDVCTNKRKSWKM